MKHSECVLLWIDVCYTSESQQRYCDVDPRNLEEFSNLDGAEKGQKTCTLSSLQFKVLARETIEALGGDGLLRVANWKTARIRSEIIYRLKFYFGDWRRRRHQQQHIWFVR